MKNHKEARGKWFTFLLYPECNAHMDILNYLLDEKVQEVQKFRVAGIMHDRDFYSEGEKQGMPKKHHIHIIMNTENRHTAPAIAKMMGGQRTVLRLYQRDEKHEHSTSLIIPKEKKDQETKGQPKQDSPTPGQQELLTGQPEQTSSFSLNSKEPQRTASSIQKGITRQYHHETGEEYPVLVDKGYGELQPVDMEIAPEIWAVIESKDNHHWDSLPECFYNNPQYPQFRCNDNQYWKLVQRQDLTHAEVIADPMAYYLYLQHKDIASLRNHKAEYQENEFFGNQELLAKLRGERGIRYQVSQVIEYFNRCGVTNGKQAYEALLYGDCTEELLNFYWKNTSKFNSYFRGCELESMNQIKEDEKKQEDSDDIESSKIDYAHKNHRELKEHIHECEYKRDKRTAEYLAQKYETIIGMGKRSGNIDQAQQEELRNIAHWFSCHPDQRLFNYVPYEEQLFNIQLYNEIMGAFREDAEHMETPDYYQAPLPTDETDDDLINWDDWHPILY